MLVADIISELDDHGFQDDTTARKMVAINDTVADVCSREAWPFMEATAAVTISTDTPTLPADFRASLALVIPSQGVVMVPERLDTVTKTYLVNNPNNSTGLPFLYYFIGNTMKVYPAPDVSYTGTLMYVRNHPTLLSTDVEAAILIPVRHHRVITLGALAKLFAMEDDPDQSMYFAKQYEDRLVMMENDSWKRQYDLPDRVVDVWADGYEGWF